MNNFDRRSLLTEAFARLRQGGVPLGVGELLDALRAAEGGWGAEGPEGLRELARLLWCHSRQEASEFDDVWEALLTVTPLPAFSGERIEPPSSRPGSKRALIPNEDGSDSMPPPSELAVAPSALQWKPLPVRAPVPALSGDEVSALQTYWPVSRRFMVYAWRYLRRLIPDGPQDVLDIEVTVDRAARQGFFLAPVYRRRESNQAHLVLLVDQAGSMAPFHRFTRDLVESACWESMLQQVDVFYFHNVPTASVYHDPHLTERVPLDQVLEQCTRDTSVVLVSDAGAARGYRRLDRVRTTTEFLARLKQRTSLLAWLNPMPRERWPSTSAQIIAHLVPMFPMDPDGLSDAIDVVRGQL